MYGSVKALVAARDAKCSTGKMGTPWDVAYASLFLASDESKYVNGAVLPVDGGLSCKSV
jgi:NAD(P)-dependent dehydrogenase (short-subunit alcohol dehydrogenase family)